MDLYRQTLEIENPLASCGACHFGSALDGTWSVEEGRLVFRAMLNPLVRRGPGFEGCSEGRDGAAVFTRATVDGKPLTDEQFAELKAAARSPEAWAEEEAAG